MAENDLLTRLLDAGMTFTALTQARAEELVRDLVRAGAVQAEQAQDGVEELLARSRRNSERVVEAVRAEIDERLDKLDLATRDDLERLVQRFADVAATVFSQRSSDRPGPSPEPGAPAAVTRAARTTTAAKKSTAKKAPARKSTAKKAPAKKSAASKAATKKSAAKKAPAKKSAAKKAPAKKSAAKKAAPGSAASGSSSG